MNDFNSFSEIVDGYKNDQMLGLIRTDTDKLTGLVHGGCASHIKDKMSCDVVAYPVGDLDKRYNVDITEPCGICAHVEYTFI